MTYLVIFLLLIIIGLAAYLILKLKKPKKPSRELEGPSIYTHEGKILKTKAESERKKKY